MKTTPFGRSIITIVSIVAAFSLGRIITMEQKPKPQPAITVTNWWDTLPLANAEPPKKDNTELVLRAYYLNQMREQALLSQQQFINAELEARRIQLEQMRMNSRIGDYDPNRWRYTPYWDR